jgi:hypothetical protein
MIAVRVRPIRRKAVNLMRTHLLLLSVRLFASVPRAAARPNLLFTYTDDQRYDALSVVRKEQGERGLEQAPTEKIILDRDLLPMPLC